MPEACFEDLEEECEGAGAGALGLYLFADEAVYDTRVYDDAREEVWV